MLKVIPLALLLLAAGTGRNALLGPEISAAFKDQTISGRYQSGYEFTETYAGDGKSKYWDPRGPMTGTWSIVGDLFCTFYDGGSLDGACFRVEKIGENCFDFFSAADSTEEAKAPTREPRYTARAAIDGKKSTCPVELQARRLPSPNLKPTPPHHA
jgi:hypothetical protein